MFGGHCHQLCDCEGEGSCHPVTGKCLCPPGEQDLDEKLVWAKALVTPLSPMVTKQSIDTFARNDTPLRNITPTMLSTYLWHDGSKSIAVSAQTPTNQPLDWQRAYSKYLKEHNQATSTQTSFTEITRMKAMINYDPNSILESHAPNNLWELRFIQSSIFLSTHKSLEYKVGILLQLS
jgi:hypothetical protein